VSKVTDVIDAMREAGAGKERLTAGWIEAASKHAALADALRVIFKRMPTTQKLGLWLSGNLGTRSEQYVLEGRHSPRNKAWRYAVRVIGESTEKECQAQAARDAKQAEAARAAVVRERIMAEGAARREAEREARRQAANTGPAFVLPVQGPASILNPYMAPGPSLTVETPTPAAPEERPYTVKPGRDGEQVKVFDLPAPTAAPKPEETPKRVMVGGNGYVTIDRPWIRATPDGFKARQPTRKELAARHRGLQWSSDYDVAHGWPRGNPNYDEWTDGVRTSRDNSGPDAWRFDGSNNWTKRL
jgi:hypothetical protein